MLSSTVKSRAAAYFSLKIYLSGQKFCEPYEQDHDLDFPLGKHLHYCLHVNTAKLSGTGHGALSW